MLCVICKKDLKSYGGYKTHLTFVHDKHDLVRALLLPLKKRTTRSAVSVTGGAHVSTRKSDYRTLRSGKSFCIISQKEPKRQRRTIAIARNDGVKGFSISDQNLTDVVEFKENLTKLTRNVLNLDRDEIKVSNKDIEKNLESDHSINDNNNNNANASINNREESSFIDSSTLSDPKKSEESVNGNNNDSDASMKSSRDNILIDTLTSNDSEKSVNVTDAMMKSEEENRFDMRTLKVQDTSNGTEKSDMSVNYKNNDGIVSMKSKQEGILSIYVNNTPDYKENINLSNISVQNRCTDGDFCNSISYLESNETISHNFPSPIMVNESPKNVKPPKPESTPLKMIAKELNAKLLLSNTSTPIRPRKKAQQLFITAKSGGTERASFIYLCHICGTFQTKDALNEHINTHLEAEIIDDILSMESKYDRNDFNAEKLYEMFQAGYDCGKKDIPRNTDLRIEFYKLYLEL